MIKKMRSLSSNFSRSIQSCERRGIEGGRAKGMVKMSWSSKWGVATIKMRMI